MTVADELLIASLPADVREAVERMLAHERGEWEEARAFDPWATETTNTEDYDEGFDAGWEAGIKAMRDALTDAVKDTPDPRQP